MPRPVHFEIHASDPAALRTFYETVFGWKFEQWGEVPYWIITTGDEDLGINGGMLPRQGPPPSGDQSVNAFVAIVGVQDVEKDLERAVGAGATVTMPVTAVPGIGWTAYIKDPDGNLLGLIQPEPMES
jgi:predicted enzyme related to lactoylglutathione lyase